jgi:hypothetical protein
VDAEAALGEGSAPTSDPPSPQPSSRPGSRPPSRLQERRLGRELSVTFDDKASAAAVRRFYAADPALLINPRYQLRTLQPLLPRPRRPAETAALARSRHVVLEAATFAYPRLTGTVVVRHIHYEKRVFLRYTVDDWEHTRDVDAVWAEPVHEPGLDRFTFDLDLTADYAVGGELRLCVGYTSGGYTHWDNRFGGNYHATMVCETLYREFVQDHPTLPTFVGPGEWLPSPNASSGTDEDEVDNDDDDDDDDDDERRWPQERPLGSPLVGTRPSLGRAKKDGEEEEEEEEEEPVPGSLASRVRRVSIQRAEAPPLPARVNWDTLSGDSSDDIFRAAPSPTVAVAARPPPPTMTMPSPGAIPWHLLRGTLPSPTTPSAPSPTVRTSARLSMDDTDDDNGLFAAPAGLPTLDLKRGGLSTGPAWRPAVYGMPALPSLSPRAGDDHAYDTGSQWG